MANHNTLFPQRPLYYLLLFGILVNIAGIGVDFFTDDPALYGMLARNMVQTNNFSELIYHGRDWLDKPHFPFWVLALSFKLFGVNTIAYKLPALLFYFMSVIYTYKLARKFYGAQTALVSVLILLTAQHGIMSNTDVRAEPYIMGLLMGAIYHFYKVKERVKFIDVVLGALFTACAVMTKGIYLLIPIGAAIIGDYLFKREWKGLLHWKWLLAFSLVCLFIVPEIYTLYQQFDLHPEKTVFGRQNISGIHWFFWDSQFGRFNNNGYITNSHGSIFFFLHTLLWAFAPWAIVFFYALTKNVINLVKGKRQPEYLCISASVLMLLIFSISKFQLPFYTNILFPLFAIITAVFITTLKPGAELKFFKISQYTICALLLIVFIAMNILFAPEKTLISVVLLLAGSVATYYIYSYKGAVYESLLSLCCILMIIINTYFAFVFYPTLLNYKGDVIAARYVNQNFAGQPIASTVSQADRFDFYVQHPVLYIKVAKLTDIGSLEGRVIFTDEAGIAQFNNSRRHLRILKTFDDYGRENLTLPFLDKKKRATALDHFYLIQIDN